MEGIKITKLINIYENEWVKLPERNTLLELEEHLIELDPYTFDILYKENLHFNKDCNDIHEIFKEQEYKLYNYDAEKLKIEDYDINYCIEECCSNYGTILLEEGKKYYCKKCYNDLEIGNENESYEEESEKDKTEEELSFKNYCDFIYPTILPCQKEFNDEYVNSFIDEYNITSKLYNNLSYYNKHHLHSLFHKKELVDKLNTIQTISPTYLLKDSLLIVKEEMIYIYSETNYESKPLNEFETLIGFPLIKNSIYMSS